MRWEARERAAAKQPDISSPASLAFTIALSREAGTQGTLVAQEVGKLLAWHVWDHELLERIAQDMGLRSRLLKSVDERQQSMLVEMAEAFLSAPGKSEWSPLVTETAYVDHLVKIVLTLGTRGENVIVGRGASFILPAETTLRVRLIAPVQDRISTLSRTLGISESEAARRVRTLDRERTDLVHDNYSKDPNNPHNYDLVFNASRVSVSQLAELIVEALRRRQAHVREKHMTKGGK